jgi:hypothetical protein
MSFHIEANPPPQPLSFPYTELSLELLKAGQKQHNYILI